ncbi:hypothetical protein ACI65C_004903 [Semiaphis heraclei]
MTDAIPKKMSWVCAYFPNSHEYCVIPMNWLLVEKGDGNSIFSLWPPYEKMTSEVVIRADPPDSTWLKFQVKIIVKTPFDDYVQAWHHLVILVESSLPNTSLIPIKEVKRRNSSQSRNVNMLTDACSSNQLLKNINLPNKGVKTGQESIMGTPESTDIHNDDSTNLNNLEIKNLLYGIFNGGVNLKFMLSQVLSKLEDLEKLFVKMKLPQTVNVDEQFLENFPINSPDELKHIEECILGNEFDFGLKLEIYIKTIGGSSFKNHVTRVLSRFISDEYATKCSWSGRGKGKLTKLRDTCLIKILKRVLQECYDAHINTDFEFEKIVAGWLKYSVLRYNKSQKFKK